MLLLKTDKARQELAPGMRTLSLRERSLLLLAEGKPLAELQAMYSGGGAEIVEHLLSQGYLSLSAPALQDVMAGQADFVQQLKDFAQGVSDLANRVQDLRAQADGEIGVAVARINTLTARIAELNGPIQRSTLDGDSASALRESPVSGVARATRAAWPSPTMSAATRRASARISAKAAHSHTLPRISAPRTCRRRAA